jgi:hypothetical protein
MVHPARTFQALYDRSSSPGEYIVRLLYRPADSLILRQWQSFLEAAALMRESDSRAAVVEMAWTMGEEASSQRDRLTEVVGILSLNLFDLWLVTWGLLGAPLALLLVAEGGLVALLGWTAWGLRRGTV